MIESHARLDRWTLGLHLGSRAILTSNAGEGSASVEIEHVRGEADWCVQINHITPSATKGRRYKITFSARSDPPRRARLCHSRNVPPWTAVSRPLAIDLRPDWRRLEAVFTAADDQAECRMHFDLGQGAGIVEFAGLVFEDLGPLPTRPEKSYIICTSARSGSTLLSDVLINTGAAGAPAEHFLYWDEFNRREASQRLPDPKMDADWRLPPQAYVARVLERGKTENGIFGTKIMWSYLRPTLQLLSSVVTHRPRTDRELLECFFPDLHLIHLVRRDKIKQAVSLFIAQRTGVWFDYGRANDQSEVTRYADRLLDEYNFDEVYHIFLYLLRHENQWLDFFSSQQFNVHSICYEDLISSFDLKIAELFNALGLPEPLTTPSLQSARTRKQSSSINQHLADLFLADLNRKGLKIPPDHR